MSQRWRSEKSTIRFSMAASVVVAGAGLFDVGFDEITVADDIPRPGRESAEHFHVLGVAAAELEHAHFVALADLLERHVVIAKLLQRHALHDQRHRNPR